MILLIVGALVLLGGLYLGVRVQAARNVRKTTFYYGGVSETKVYVLPEGQFYSLTNSNERG